MNPQESQSQTGVSPTENAKKTRFRILILDDDAHLCQMLSDILEEYNYSTRTSETREEALAAITEFHPHIALVDFKLGDVSGLDVAHEMKPLDPQLPIILMTAYPTLDLAVKAIQSDIYDFLSKPVDTTYLLRAINNALETRKLQEENINLIASLKKSNEQLERLNQMKSKFLSVVSHDLRTPLTSIRGYAEFMKDPNTGPSEYKLCINSILVSTDRMNYLISNLMDMFSIEQGRLRVELENMNYQTVFKELEQTYAPVAKEKGIQMVWKIPNTNLPILGDNNRLVQLLTNFISNAFKHTAQGQSITITVTADGAKIRTEVKDSGEGIAAEHIGKIFDQFYQVESSATRRQGLGLGLSISKEIVSAHKGEIGVSSEGLGKGTAFYFTLPMVPI